uniref:Mediator of RNA polymerase II transcription subunit 4 n=2 Tax=Mesocestoides corti TaxID=53468 RepID=A0A5K3G6G0_MESCO
MSTGISTKHRLLCQLEEIDGLLKDLLDKVNRKSKFDDFEHVVLFLLDKDKEVKETLKTVSEQMEMQVMIEKLRADCANSDVQINSCQKQLKKCELLLSTALYYSRQKLDSMVNAIKNPIDVDDLTKFAHRISCSYGVLAPDNWSPGDPRRPYPNKEEIRRGYLGHLDDTGKFLPSLRDAVALIHPVVTSTPTPVLTTPIGSETTPGHIVMNPINQTHNPASRPCGVHENTHAYSPSIGLPGVNMVSSPGMPPSNGGGGQWSDQAQVLQQPRHLPTPSSATSSLTAILSGVSTGGVNNRAPRSGASESPSPQTPSSGNRTLRQQQQQRYGLPAGYPSAQHQQSHRKRQFTEESRMYSDTSSDDDARIDDFPHHVSHQPHHPGF